jgi:cytoskeletal protein CcmA (bactofilin family)
MMFALRQACFTAVVLLVALGAALPETGVAQEQFFTQSGGKGLQNAKTNARLTKAETEIGVMQDDLRTIKPHARAELGNCSADGEKLRYDGTNWVCDKETDPTVQEFAKKALPSCSAGTMLGVQGGELGCSTVGFVTQETDPTVQEFAKQPLPQCASEQLIAVGANNTLRCITDQQGLTAETDPKVYEFARKDVVGALPNCPVGELLTMVNGRLGCRVDQVGLSVEVDPQVQDFARKDNGEPALAACAAGEVLRSSTVNGKIILVCENASGALTETLALNDLTDVTTAGQSSGTTLTYSNGQWRAIPGIGSAANPLYLNQLGDTQISSPVSDEVLRWDGTRWVNSDDKLGTLTDTNWCRTVGTEIVCDRPPPLTCSAGEILSWDGTANTWLCTNAASAIGSAIMLNDLGDVTITTVVTGQVVRFDGTGWVNSTIERILAADTQIVATDTGTDGLLSFATDGTTRMAITNQGRVGIGVMPASPYMLDVSGSIRASGDISATDFYGRNGFFGGNLTVAGNLNISGSQSIDGVLFANGGITLSGTVTSGNISVTNLSATLADIRTLRGNTLSYTSATLVNATIAQATLTNISVTTADLNLLRAAAAVITSATIANLNATQANLSNISATNADLTNNLRVSGTTWLQNLNVLGNLNVSGTQTIDGVLFANGGIALSGTVTSGNISVTNLSATVADIRTLRVTGQQYNSGNLYFYNTPGFNPSIFVSDTSNDQGLSIRINGTETARFQDNGHVYVGRFSTFGGMNFGDFFVQRGSEAGIDFPGSNIMRFGTGLGITTEYARFSGTGNLGIGIVNPAARLEVAGLISGTGFSITGNGTITGGLTAGSLGTGPIAATNISATRLDLTNNLRVSGTTWVQDLNVLGNLNVSGAQVIDGVLFANGGIAMSGTIASGNISVTNLSASVADIRTLRVTNNASVTQNFGVGGGVSVTGNVQANRFIGSGASLTDIPASAVTGLQLDRISTTGVSSGPNLAMVVADQGTISFTLAGNPGRAYLDSTLGLVAPGVSTTGAVSGTVGYFTNRLGIGTSNLTNGILSVSGSLFQSGNIARLSWGLYSITSPTLRLGDDQYGMASGNGQLGFWTANNGFSFNDSVSNTNIALLTNSGRFSISGTIKIANSGEACDANRLGAIRYTGNEFSFCRNGTAWETLASIVQGTADRITSGTTQFVVISNTGFISLTQAGTNTGWFDPTRGLVTLGVSATGGISGTTGYFGILRSPLGLIDTLSGTNISTSLIDATRNGTVTATYIYGRFISTTNLLANGFSQLNQVSATNISATGNIQATRFIGDGSGLTGVAAGSADWYTLTNIPIQVQNVSNGTTLTMQTLSATAVNGLNVSGTNGFFSNLSAGAIAANTISSSFISATTAQFRNVSITNNLTVAGTVTAGAFIGDGSGLTGVIAAGSDRITSGTTQLVVISQTGFISLTQAGSNTGWFDPTRGLVTLGVSTTGPVSTTLVGINNNYIRFDGAANQVQFFTNGSSRAAFNSSGNLAFQNNYGIVWSNNSILGDAAVSTSNIRFSVANTERLRIISSGLVGIGTSTPTTALQVSGTIRMASGGENCDANRLGAIRYAGADFEVCRNGTAWETLSSIASGGSPNWNSIVGIPTNVANVSNGTTLTMQTLSATAVNGLNISGTNGFFPNLSAGAIAANSVSSGLVSATNISGTFAQLRNISTTNISATGNIQANRFIGDGSGLTNLNVQGDRITSGTTSVITNNNTSITFTTAGAERMVIGSNGNVGIGTSTPGSNIGERLSVQGAAYITGDIFAPRFIDQDNSNYFIDPNSTTIAGLFAGRIGIGTLSPSSSLHVFTGEIQTASSGAACTALLAGAIRYTAGSLQFCNNANTWVTLGSAGSADWYGLSNIPTNIANVSNGTTLTMQTLSATAVNGLNISGTNGFFSNLSANAIAANSISSSFISATNISGTFAQLRNISTTNISATGNIQATRFIGDGSQLTGLNVQGDRITSGTTSVVAQNNNAVSITIAGSEVANFNSGGLALTNLNASGAVSITQTAYISGSMGLGMAPSSTQTLSVNVNSTNSGIAVHYQGGVAPVFTIGAGSAGAGALRLPTASSAFSINNNANQAFVRFLGANSSILVGTGVTIASRTLHVNGGALITSWTGMNFGTGNNVTPSAPLEVSGTISATTLKTGPGETCASSLDAGAIRYTGGALSFCNGSIWVTLGSAGSADWYGLTNIPANVANVSNGTTLTMQTLSATAVNGLNVSGTNGFFPNLSANAIAANSVSSSLISATNISGTFAQLRNISTTNISATGNIQATRFIGDGSQLTNLASASASPTNVPAFSVHRNVSNQTVSSGAWTKINFTTETFDQTNDFDTGNSRFQPTLSGRYLITLNVQCSSATDSCFAGIFKNGAEYASASGSNSNTAGFGSGAIAAVVDLNGTTDFIEGHVYNQNGTVLVGTIARTRMTGSLLASGNGLISGTTPGGVSGSIQFNNGGSSLGGAAGLLWDGNTNTVSLTGTLSATNVYGLNISGTNGFFPNLSAGAIAANSVSSTNISATNISVTLGQFGRISGTNISASTGDFSTLRINGVAVGAGGADWYGLTNIPTQVQNVSNGTTLTMQTLSATAINGLNISGTNGFFGNLSANAIAANSVSSGLISASNISGTLAQLRNVSITNNLTVNGLISTSTGIYAGPFVQLISDTSVCNGTTAGRISYNSGALLYCSGTNWTTLAAGGSTAWGSLTGIPTAITSLSTLTATAGQVLAFNGTTYTGSSTINLAGLTMTGQITGTIITANTLSATNVYGLNISGTNGFFPNLSAGAIAANSVSSTNISATNISVTLGQFGRISGTNISASTGDFSTLRVNGVDITSGGGGGSSTLAMVTGTYTGNGATSQTITLGFRPRMVVIKGTGAAFTFFPQVVTFDGIPDANAELYSYDADNNAFNFVDITATGFRVVGGANDSSLNFNTRVYNYIAFRDAGVDAGATDRITSSTTAAVIANENGGTVSFTLGGTADAAYLHPTLGLVAPGVSTTGPISATAAWITGLLQANRISATNISASVGDFSTLRVGGVAVGSGGVARLASLTDVSLSNLTGLDILRYNGTSWTNVNVQDAISTTTMVAGWPDAIMCLTSGEPRTFYYIGLVGSNRLYRGPSTIAYDISYNNLTGNYASNSNAGTVDCVTNAWSIGQLYSNGRAFNFIGGSGTVTPTVDRIISGTSNIVINSSTGVVSFTQLGTATAYLHPTLGLVAPGVSTTGPISATAGWITGLLQANRISATNISASVGDFSTLRVGGVAVGSGGVARLASLTDVSLSNLTGLDILRYNGTSWTNVNVQNAISTTTMAAGWPDAIYCEGTGGGTWLSLQVNNFSSGARTYRQSVNTAWIQIFFTSAGAYDSLNNSGYTNFYESCVNQSIGQLYAAGRAFNFIGGSGTVTPTVDRMISGTSNVVVNSSTGVVSFTQLGTATAYLHPTLGLVAPGVSTTGPISATAAWVTGLLQANRISATNISASVGDFSTLRVNGVDITGGGGGGSSTLAMVTGTYTGNGATSQTITLGFRPRMVVIKGTGAAFTYFPQVVTFDGIPDGNGELRSYEPDNYGLTNTVDITATGFRVIGNANDSAMNFNTRVYNYIAFRDAGVDAGATDRITSSTTAAVIANENGGTVSFTLGSTAGAAYLHPTLGLVAPGVSTTGPISATAGWITGLLQANRISATNISASVGDFSTLRVGGVAVGSGGVARLASLTDVSLSGLSTGQILRYNGTSWTNVNVQNAISTTTMVTDWPDAIICDGGGQAVTLYRWTETSAGVTTYIWAHHTAFYTITYSAVGAYSSQAGLAAYDCVTNAWSIGQLYSNNRAFNFIGGSGTVTPTVDRMISGTSNVVVNSSTGVVSFTQLGTATAYLHPTLGLVAPGVSTTGPISATAAWVTGLLQANRISATNISASTGDFSTLRINGVAVGAGGADWYGLTNIPTQVQNVSNGTTLTMQTLSATAINGLNISGTNGFFGNLSANAIAANSVSSGLISASNISGTLAQLRNVSITNNLTVNGLISTSTGIYAGPFVQLISDTSVCNGTTAGRISYNSGALLYCSGTNWTTLAAGGSTAWGSLTGIPTAITSLSTLTATAGQVLAFNGTTYTGSSTINLAGLTMTGQITGTIITANTLSATNVYGLNISGTNGFFPNLSAGAIAANSVSSTNISATNISGTFAQLRNISASVGDFSTLRVNGVDIASGLGPD